MRRLPLFLVAPVLLLAACSGSPPPEAGPPPVLAGAPEGEVVARVGGEAITAPLLDAYARGSGMDPDDPAQRRRALDALVESVVLAREARARGIADDPAVRAERTLAALQPLAGRGLAAVREGIEVSEEALQDYYAREVVRAGSAELQLQHMLFDDRDLAGEAIARARAEGADFAALMGQYAGRGARQARDLGWVNGTQLPEGLFDAALALEDGAVTPEPVQSRFGWHVIRRVASRPFSPPSFDSVREGAEQQLAARQVAERVRALREAAGVEIVEGAGGAD